MNLSSSYSRANLKFSIVLPTYNRAHLIKKTIESIIAQSYVNFEIIVVDDGSTDNTVEVLQSIKDERFNYYLKANGERGAARNFGAQKATGHYVNFFDSDDLLYESHLEEAYQLITQHNEPEVFHLWYDIQYQSNKKRIDPVPENINTALLKGNCLSCNGVFIRSDIARQYPFNEDRKLAASEDYLLWLQLAARFQFYQSATVTSTIVQHDERSVLTTNAEALIIRKQLMLKYLFEDEESSQVYQRHRAALTADAYLMIALHIALTKKQRILSAKYLFKALTIDMKSVAKKQFWGTVKHLLI